MTTPDDDVAHVNSSDTGGVVHRSATDSSLSLSLSITPVSPSSELKQTNNDGDDDHTTSSHRAIKLRALQHEVDTTLLRARTDWQLCVAMVRAIRKDTINEIRSYRMPPLVIRHLLGSVLILQGDDDLSWVRMITLLARATWKDMLVDIDVTRVTPVMRRRVRNIMNESPLSFDDDHMMHINPATPSLGMWVRGVLQYSVVMESLTPLNDEIKRLSTLQ